ncbi:MAG: hypothetical protein JW836_07575 [Deltaproteobacteria bacterium]|nr:hypothetical protein [Deltaproteobacteria bacterium]
MGVPLETAKRREPGRTLKARGGKGGRRGFTVTSGAESSWTYLGRPPPASPVA